MKVWDRVFGKREEIAELQAEVVLGDLFAEWAKSDIGRYIIGRAEQYELETLQKLAKADPKDTLAIIKLQEEAKIPGKILAWVNNAIEAGDVAKFQLSEHQGD